MANISQIVGAVTAAIKRAEDEQYRERMPMTLRQVEKEIETLKAREKKHQEEIQLASKKTEELDKKLGQVHQEAKAREQQSLRDAEAREQILQTENKDMRARLLQTERDVGLLWDLHRMKEHLDDKTFLTSNWKRFYSRSLAIETDPEQFWRKVEEVLTAFYMDESAHFSVHEAERNAVSFAAALQSEVDRATATSNAPPELAASCAWKATRAWTAAAQDPYFKREWCSILNQIAREDKAPLVDLTAVIQATMAGFNVLDRTKAAPPIAWPQADTQEEAAWTLFRGGRMPEEHCTWYEGHTGKRIRIPMNLATTKNSTKAKEFMNCLSYPKTLPKVMFHFKLDPDLHCDHANCVESLTLVPGEQEFLFPPYSAFGVVSVERKTGHSVITLTVESDNRSVREDVALAPWA